ncbi:hypothetical protein IM538_04215 [Cytobacillus suaedae]|nr:hypothetical protein IM538_04215 [Cytobacillus suaedae]
MENVFFKLVLIFVAINLKVIGAIQLIFELNTYNIKGNGLSWDELMTILIYDYPMYVFLSGMLLIVLAHFFPLSRKRY